MPASLSSMTWLCCLVACMQLAAFANKCGFFDTELIEQGNVAYPKVCYNRKTASNFRSPVRFELQFGSKRWSVDAVRLSDGEEYDIRQSVATSGEIAQFYAEFGSFGSMSPDYVSPSFVKFSQSHVCYGAKMDVPTIDKNQLFSGKIVARAGEMVHVHEVTVQKKGSYWHWYRSSWESISPMMRCADAHINTFNVKDKAIALGCPSCGNTMHYNPSGVVNAESLVEIEGYSIQASEMEVPDDVQHEVAAVYADEMPGQLKFNPIEIKNVERLLTGLGGPWKCRNEIDCVTNKRIRRDKLIVAARLQLHYAWAYAYSVLGDDVVETDPLFDLSTTFGKPVVNYERLDELLEATKQMQTGIRDFSGAKVASILSQIKNSEHARALYSEKTGREIITILASIAKELFYDDVLSLQNQLQQVGLPTVEDGMLKLHELIKFDDCKHTYPYEWR